jgi:hypothetical protein
MSLSADTERKINLLLKGIKEVGFPIVVAGFLLYYGTSWADRLLSSQELFVKDVGTNYKTQTDIMVQLVDMSEKQGANIQLIATAQAELISISKQLSGLLDKIAEKNGIK